MALTHSYTRPVLNYDTILWQQKQGQQHHWTNGTLEYSVCLALAIGLSLE